jgi:BirA family transcriptional regulator, biotin operon repressor / biotin---[acetyl-CoA-carboxylase] ligase
LLPYLSTIPPLGQPFTVLPVVDSTNNYAMAQVQAGKAGHGSVFMALEQTAGKGQRGKQWHTASGENIAMSIVVDPYPLTITQQQLLSFAVALACYDLYKKYAGEENTRIKWPNDLYWQDRKAGGILIESIIGANSVEKGDNDKDGVRAESRWKWAIIGIGININQVVFPESLVNPVSLKQITGKFWDPLELARELCGFLDIRFRWVVQQPANQIIKEYNASLYKLGESIKLRKDSIVFSTELTGVTESGQLVTKDAIERVFDFGEVEWVIS